MTTYFEDIAVGDTDEFGTYDVTEEEILAFAGQYDPQPFHTDPDAAAETIYGGLIASGWHTAAMGARGVEELRFPRPVRPGDSLSVRTEVLEKSADSADRGTVRVRSETVTEDDETVLSMISEVMYARR